MKALARLPLALIIVLALLSGAHTVSACDFVAASSSAPQVSASPRFVVRLRFAFGPAVGVRLKLSPSQYAYYDGGPASGAKLENQFAVTDRAGLAHFHLRKGGRYLLQADSLIGAEKQSSAELREIIVDASAKPSLIDIVWKLKLARLVGGQGRVTSGLFPMKAEPGADLPDVRLTLVSLARERRVAQAWSDERGLFRFANIPSGLYRLRVAVRNPSNWVVKQEEIYAWVSAAPMRRKPALAQEIQVSNLCGGMDVEVYEPPMAEGKE